LVTYNRIGKGSTPLSYWTSTFYMPARTGNNQPELSPLTGPFYRTLKRRSAQPAAAPALRAQHAEWAAAHPDFRIEMRYPDSRSEPWRDALVDRVSAGRPPDASTVDHPWLGDVRGSLQPLTDHVADIDDFFPFVREQAMRDGELLAAWKYTDCRCLYYRRDLVAQYADGQPPQTWDDLVAFGRAVAANEGIAGFLHYPSSATSLPLVWSQGASFVDDAGDPVIGRPANRRALVRALSFLQRLVESGATPRRTARVESYERLTRAGRAGAVGAFIGGNWQIERGFKNRVEGDRWRRWGVAPVPRPESGEHVTLVGGWTEGAFMPGDGPAARATREFVAKFVEPRSMGRYCEAAGLLPTRESLFDDRSVFDPDAIPYYQTFRRLLRDGRAQPSVPVYSTVVAAFERALRAVLAGDETPAAAADATVRAVTDAAGET
jgi:multiple sugar transport system substrate-binding protein